MVNILKNQAFFVMYMMTQRRRNEWDQIRFGEEQIIGVIHLMVNKIYKQNEMKSEKV